MPLASNAGMRSAGKPDKKKSSSGGLVAAIIVAALVLLGVVAYCQFASSTSSAYTIDDKYNVVELHGDAYRPPTDAD